jgi:hypothetical protein
MATAALGQIRLWLPDLTACNRPLIVKKTARKSIRFLAGTTTAICQKLVESAPGPPLSRTSLPKPGAP